MRHRRASMGGLVSAAFALSLVVSPAAAAPSARASLAGSVPSWASASAFKGAADPNGSVGFRVYLGWTNEAGAQALARAVSDPKSPSYGHYVTPAQFRARFAPSASTIAAIQSWLRSAGFTIDYTPLNDRYVAAEGTVAQAEAAFGTQINEYSVKGKLVRSQATALSIPAAFAGAVDAVVGLDDSAQFVQLNQVVDAPPPGGFRNAPPLSAYWAEQVSSYAYPSSFTDVTTPATVPWSVKGNMAAQIRGAYGIPSSATGAGQTVAIIDAYASPTIVSDANTYFGGNWFSKASNFTQVVAPGTFIRPQNPRQDPQGWSGEETLDIEAVHGMAPDAHIVYVGAPNNYQDLDAALNHVVDRGLAHIVTNSYGFPTEALPFGYIKPYNDTFIQAAAEGIGVYFSSGDNGDETATMGYATPDWPASSPWVTAVGGTALAVDQNNARVFETGWGTANYSCGTTPDCTRKGWLYGAGGGFSKLFSTPWYQDGLQFDGKAVSGRAVPDVAALADPQTGMLIGQTQTFPDGAYYDTYRIGGTSLASPVFAGLMALADQQAGTHHGFANPTFYANRGAFSDITSVKTAVARANFNNGVSAANGISYFLRTLDDYSGSPTQHTATGWDDVTGLGVPNGSTFIGLP